ncbi:MAG: FKBP-type peptidyl-prolyl cis-trans isomerase [Actinobacteria bacterium]|nr:FKBP-type peptidyl-prolyl cis-trans isomerase [Actinomycetota bacterium]
MKRSRALLALMPVAMVAGLLTACSGGVTSSIDGVTCAPEGEISKTLEFKGDFGAEKLELKTKTPIKAKDLQASTPIKGDGEQVKEDDTIEAQLSLFNGKNGEALQSGKSSLQLSSQGLQPWALEVLSCASVGDRVAAVAPAADVLGDAAEQMGVDAKDAIVMVFDVLSAEQAKAEPGTLEPNELLKKAEGEAQKLPEGLPKVELAEDGSPTITMPEGAAAPDKLTVETLIKGDGEEVQEGDRVYVHYRGVIWRTGEEFDSSWSRGEPIGFLTTGVIGGFSKALVGQTVGSQVMSIVPAEDGGYGAAGLQQQGHQPDDVMVFVLDILGTVHAE